MRFWVDTEFIEDGKTIDLLSIGVVAEDGQTYYAEFEGCDTSRASEWVRENVLPSMTGRMKPRSAIAADLVAFMGERPEIWGYYADYDWVAICQLYGTMMQLPAGWPMYALDVKQWAFMLGDPTLPPQEEGEHNALNDARWTKDAWEFLGRLEFQMGTKAAL